MDIYNYIEDDQLHTHTVKTRDKLLCNTSYKESPDFYFYTNKLTSILKLIKIRILAPFSVDLTVLTFIIFEEGKLFHAPTS